MTQPDSPPDQAGEAAEPSEDKASEDQRAFEHGSGGANADAAVEDRPSEGQSSVDAPYARPVPRSE